MRKNLLLQRTVSGFPLSIGTGLALESILEPVQEVYDPQRVVPEKIKLNKYDAIWFNIDTLVRNIVGSVPTEVQKDVGPGMIYEVLTEEMDLIELLIGNQYNKAPEINFYFSKYSAMKNAHPHALLRSPTTQKQIDTAHQELAIQKQLLKDMPDRVLSFDRSLVVPNKNRSIVMTHKSYDLLSYPRFHELDLLESHTGALKGRSLWYTKFVTKGLVRIPFNMCFAQVFGDSQTFSPMPGPVRKQILELSEKYEWHALTTTERLKYCFSTLQDRFTATVLNEMLAERAS
jgi:hypothetical protein